jgi:hypothetical protein
MGVFNIIETFFFISLAISFVLIFLLVNHFKQRINVIEQKSDTLFEIINNVVQQIDSMTYRINCERATTQKVREYANINSKSTPEINVNGTEDNVFISNNRVDLNEKIVVSEDDDNEDEDDEDEDDEDDDDDEDTDEEDDAGDDDEYEYAVKPDINMQMSENDFEKNEELLEETDVVLNESKIKIISVDILEKINVENLDDDDGQELTDLEETLPELLINNDEIIQIEKIEKEEEIYDNPDKNNDNLKDFYNKMTVQDLKKLVITKGICSDVSRMKKNDLLKLLENVEI